MHYDYEILIIGSGSGGLTVALGLAAAGKKIALVERGKIGGDCTNYGCVPSKALIDIAKSKRHTLSEALVEMRRRRQMIQDEETPERIEAHGLRVIQGFASFKDTHTVLIDGKTEVTAKCIVVSTGSHASKIEITGTKEGDILTNETIFEMTEDIKNLVIVGGGYIGCELAEAFSNLGVQVTILERNDRILKREEKESSELLRNRFEKKGIKILTKVDIQKSEDGYLLVHDKDGITQHIRYDKILMALGRETNIRGLALENAGIKVDKGIIVDTYNRTHAKNIFAIGDCVDGNPQFTHLANNEGRGVVRNILVPFPKSSVRNSVLPAVLYTDIEIARVGKTEEDILIHALREDFRTEILHFATNDRSKITTDTEGFIKIHFKRISGKILGATIVGTSAGEMIPILVSAMEQGTSAYQLSKIIFPYPTKSENIKKVCDRFVIYTVSNIKNEIRFFLKNHILQISAGLIWISILVGFLYFKGQNDYTNLGIAKELYLFLVKSYWGPFVYIIVYAIRPLVLFPATFLTFMSGALFGPIGGFIYTMIGENMSANFAYFLGRLFGKKIIPEGSSGVLADLKSRFERSSFIPILMTRFLFFPFDLVNYGAGILKVHWKGFFWGTALGIIPGASVFILAGASVQNVESFDFSKIYFDMKTLGFSVIIFILSLLLAKGIKILERNKKTSY